MGWVGAGERGAGDKNQGDWEGLWEWGDKEGDLGTSCTRAMGKGKDWGERGQEMDWECCTVGCTGKTGNTMGALLGKNRGALRHGLGLMGIQ